MTYDELYEQTFGDRYPAPGSTSFFATCAICYASVDQNFRREHTEWHARQRGIAIPERETWIAE